jgi:excisionase family DNA binding protein
MDQAIDLLRTTRSTFYRWVRSGKLKGMKVGRQWRFHKLDIEQFLKGQEPRIELPADIKPLVRALRELVEKYGAQDVTPPEENDLFHAVSLMIRLGEAMAASDIHIEPHGRPGTADGVVSLRYRVDGALYPVAEIDLRLLPAIIEQWKRLSACDVRERRRPQYGRIMIHLNDTGKLLDIRVSFLPSALGESVTARVLDRDVAASLELGRIDFSPEIKERYVRALARPWGLIVVNGPAGCGKTTTLYAGLNHIAGPDRKIITIEDPVEYLHPWCLQVPINPAAGVTYQTAMIAALRSAPNVIMVGEMRDLETVDLCLSAALTGHLVLTTLHTTDSPGALRRMVEVGAEPFKVTEATKLVLSQRLVRKLCEQCCEADQPRESLLRHARELALAAKVDWDSLPKAFRRPKGCTNCVNTGFRGRTVIAEALEMTPGIVEALERGVSGVELRSVAIQEGMVTFAAEGIRRAARGETSLEEVLHVAGDR